LTIEEKAHAIAEAAAHRRAADIIILDLRALTSICDYFVICTGRSPVHVKAVADEIARTMAEGGSKPGHIEGLSEGRWVLLDFLSVVAHVFTGEAREYYQLEQLWWDAPREEVASTIVTPSGTADPFDEA
jgi:ribosome-associated protein